MIVTPQGLNVFPEDVERALTAEPGVKDAAVVGLNVNGEERVHAVLVLAPGTDADSVVRGANAQLEDHQRVWSTSVWPGRVSAPDGWHAEAQAARHPALGIRWRADHGRTCQCRDQRRRGRSTLRAKP